jgi:hypothetical protein
LQLIPPNDWCYEGAETHGHGNPEGQAHESSSFYQWAVFLSEGEMAFGGELETVVTLSPLPHLLGLLDSASPYSNLSSLGQKPKPNSTARVEDSINEHPKNQYNL